MQFKLFFQKFPQIFTNSFVWTIERIVNIVHAIFYEKQIFMDMKNAWLLQFNGVKMDKKENFPIDPKELE